MGGLFDLLRGNFGRIEFQEADIGERPSVSNTIHSVISLVRRNPGRIVIVTGAGVSSHQLPTFRSGDDTGLWESFSPTLLDRSSFYQNPAPTWKLLGNVRNLQVTRILHPSLTHHVIHHLLQRRIVAHVITQNIDGLHSFSDDTDYVTELHGAVSDFGICQSCAETRPADHLAILRTSEPPECGVCGAVLKPPVAFFGDGIDEAKRHSASQAVSQCNVLILVGTHCTVDPVLSVAIGCKRANGLVVEMNASRTPATKFVDVSLRGKADDFFMEIAKQLMPDVEWEEIKLSEWDCTWQLPPSPDPMTMNVDI
jgi:NAD-dependent deacetylase